MLNKLGFFALRCSMASRAIRALTDMNQDEMAKELDVIRTTVSSIEGLHKTPRGTTLIALEDTARRHGMTFEFKNDGMHIHVSNDAAYALLEKLDPFHIEVIDKQ